MEAGIRAGAWKQDITPPIGTFTGNIFGYKQITEIQTKLFSHALVISDGKKEIAIVSLGICAIVRDKIFDKVAIEIEKTCGIPKSNFIMATTHSNFDPTINEENEQYYKLLIENIVISIKSAMNRMKPARVGVTALQNENHIFNRRLKKPDGSIVMNFTDPEFLKDCIDDGIVDNTMTVVKFEEIENEQHEPKLIGCIVNYSLHNKVSHMDVSSDACGHMEKILEKIYGEEIVLVYLSGASADVNFIDFRNPQRRSHDYYYRTVGKSMSGTFLEAEAIMEYPEVQEIDILRETIKIADRPYCEYDTKIDTTFGPGKDSIMFQYFIDNFKVFEKVARPETELDISTICIGNEIAIASNPSLLFSEYGTKIKQGSPFKYTLVTDLTNGAVGYVPTQKAFEEGGYEVRKIIGGNYGGSHLEKSAGETIVWKSIELLKKIKEQ